MASVPEESFADEPTELGGVTVEHRFRAGRGVRLHCAEAGPADGPPVILLHGFPDFWWGWRQQVAPLARAGFRVIVPDGRGYNVSDRPQGVGAYALDLLADDVLALMSGLGGGPVPVVGHDWGGVVAWHLGARAPERVSRLVVINAPHPAAWGPYAARHPTQVLRSGYVAFFQLPLVPEAALGAANFAALKGALVRTSRPGTFTGPDLSRYRRAWGRPGALTGMLNWYRALAQRGGARHGAAARVRVPTLQLWGERDGALERGLAERNLELCDAGRGMFFPDATHWVHQELPDAVNPPLIAHLRG